jgi:hypothetical protein
MGAKPHAFLASTLVIPLIPSPSSSLSSQRAFHLQREVVSSLITIIVRRPLLILSLLFVSCFVFDFRW